MTKKAQPKRVLAFGFDKLGFVPPRDEVKENGYDLSFVHYAASASLGAADGVILPSGIFEQWEQRPTSGFENSSGLVGDVHAIAARTKELLHHSEEGGWICILLSQVRFGPRNEWADTDLAKSIISSFFDRVEAHDPIPNLQCKSDDFRTYLKEFGIAQTTLSQPKGNRTCRILATAGQKIVAAELGGKYFFLPLPSLEKDLKTLLKLTTLAVNALLAYKQKNDLYLPPWAETIQFKAELIAIQQLRELEQQVEQSRKDILAHNRYKGIVTTSGNALQEITTHILRTFFRLNLRDQEQYVEDAIIYNDSGTDAILVVEIKGVKGGLKREHVTQVEAHRDRLGILDSVPGLLIINDFMEIDGLEERKQKRFDQQHLNHAQKLNIKILRTSTLLEIMLGEEQNPERKELLLDLCVNANPLVLYTLASHTTQ
jgi:hypothetical protein